MKITPLEIRQHEFEKTFRGYNTDEVDNFLSNISQEWERVLNDSKMLRMQLEIAEKEASKLREIEMTLFKTLKTAEDTSTMITEQASQQADKYVIEAREKGEQIITEAQEKAQKIIKQAEERAKYIKEEVLGDVKILEKDFKAMNHYKDNLMVQMKSLANATLDHVERFEQKFDKVSIDTKFNEATNIIEDDSLHIPAPEPVLVVEQVSTEAIEPIVEETKEEVTEIVENLQEPETAVETPAIIEEPVLETKVLAEEETPIITKIAEVNDDKDTDDLAIIEGIGPKIANLLFDNGIFTFRQLATTPAYRIKDMLEEAGPQYAMHDPTSWVEQALLAAEGNWDELKTLQDRLVGGREIASEPAIKEPDLYSSATENTVIEVKDPESVAILETIEPVAEEKIEVEEPTPIQVAERVRTQPENNVETITEEMLEKVNKVKMAIRKAMVEKGDSQVKDTTPLPTVKDVIAKQNEGGGSFFDNL